MIEREREKRRHDEEREKQRHDKKIEMGRKRTTRQGKGRMTAAEVREKC